MSTAKHAQNFTHDSRQQSKIHTKSQQNSGVPRLFLRDAVSIAADAADVASAIVAMMTELRVDCKPRLERELSVSLTTKTRIFHTGEPPTDSWNICQGNELG